MSSYPISRTRSEVVIRQPFNFERPIIQRTRSVTNINSTDYSYKPQYYPYWPSHYYRDWDYYDTNFYERYNQQFYRTSPSIKTYNYSQLLPNYYYWSTFPSSYTSRYLGYWNDYDYPRYRPRYYDYYSNLCSMPTWSYLTPYRDQYTSQYGGSYLENKYLPTLSYWDRRFYSRGLYGIANERSYLPVYYRRRYGSGWYY